MPTSIPRMGGWDGRGGMIDGKGDVREDRFGEEEGMGGWDRSEEDCKGRRGKGRREEKKSIV